MRFVAGDLAFQEFAFSYASVLLDDKENFVKGGVTLKYLIGLGGAYLRVDELQYELLDEDSIRFRSANMNAGYTSDAYFSDPDRRLFHYLGKQKLGSGMGVDLGIVYEYRPNFKDYYYRMDRRKHEDRTANKYVFKIGAAITDLGRINFDHSPYTRNLNVITDGDSTDWVNFESVKKFSDSDDIDSFALHLFPASTVDSSFRMTLPTSLNLNVDMHLTDNWYGSASYIQTLQGNKVRGVRKQNIFSVGARYETRRFESGAHVVVGHFYNPILLGAFLRYGPVYVGSDNLGGIFTGKSTNGFNLFAGIQLPILHNLIPDEDGDGVSDEKDKCLGVFGSDRAYGCPDEDDDRVPDDQDQCPDQPGTKKTKGCPDPDEDGVVGLDDKCPDIPGEPENEGCPDTDEDGVPDHLDACKTEKGPAEYNGCPDPPKEEEEEVEEEIEKPVVEKKEPVVEREKPKTTPTSVALTPRDVVDLMDFDTYDYYLILGAYKNKTLADALVKRLNNEAGVLTYIYYDEAAQMNYVTFGRAIDRETALNHLATLSKPSVESRINGHVWWKKVPK
jgi:cell division septation protein DedD